MAKYTKSVAPFRYTYTDGGYIDVHYGSHVIDCINIMDTPGETLTRVQFIEAIKESHRELLEMYPPSVLADFR